MSGHEETTPGSDWNPASRDVYGALFAAGRDPAQVFREQLPYAFSKENGRYQLELALPFPQRRRQNESR